MKMVFIARFKNIWDEEPIAQAFEDLGVEVHRIEEQGAQSMRCLEEIERIKPDFVLFTKLQIPGAVNLIESLKNRDIPTVSWTFDLLLGHPPRQRVVKTFHFLWADLTILTDGGHIKEYTKLGVNQKVLRQGIPKEFNYRATETDFDYDIVFLGTKNRSFPYRQKLMGFLTGRYGDKFTWIGRDNSFSIRGHELNKLYAGSKIIIGDSMYSDSYWSNRIYEVIGRGGFLIRPFIKDIDKEFTLYKDFVPYYYGDFKGLAEKIDYFLERPKLREEIASHGFNTMKNKYTFNHRCKQFLKIYEDFISKRGKRTSKKVLRSSE